MNSRALSSSILLLLLLLASPVCRAGVTPFRATDFLGVSLNGHALPEEELRKGLKSGFTTTLVARIHLKEKGSDTALLSRDYVFAAYLDLWDEVIHSSLSELGDAMGAVRETQRFTSPDQVLSHLSKLRLPAIEKLSMLQRGKEYWLDVHLALDPIQKDKLEHIRKWISDHSVATKRAPGQALGPGTVSRPNRVFSSLLESSLTQELAAAKWSTSLKSEPFRIQQLQELPPSAQKGAP